MKYLKATGSHYEGTASYWHEAHATLIKGWNYEADPVFSSAINSCAYTSATNDPEIQTCGSQWQNTHHGGQWLLIAGFEYDHHNDGYDDYECPGCIDTKWAVP